MMTRLAAYAPAGAALSTVGLAGFAFSLAFAIVVPRVVPMLATPIPVAVVVALIVTAAFAASRAQQRRTLAHSASQVGATKRTAVVEYHRLLDRLAELETRAAEATSTNDVCRALRKFVASTVPCRGLYVARVDPITLERVYLYAYAERREEDPRALPAAPLGTDTASRAIVTRRMVIANAAGVREPADEGDPLDTAVRCLPRSTIAVPILKDGSLLGVFEVHADTMEAYASEHVVALRMAANLMAITLQNQELWARKHRLRQKVEASEARFRSVVENSGDIVTLLDRNGTVLYESPSVERLLGRAPECRSVTEVLDLLHPDDVPSLKAALRGVDETDRTTLTYRVRHADGGWRWFEANAVNLLDDPHVSAVVLNARDITEHVEAEQALREERAFQEAVTNSLPGTFYVVDTKGRLLRWNKEFIRLLGYSDEDIEGMQLLDLFDIDHQDLVMERMADVLRDGAATARATVVTCTGERLPFLLTGVRVTLRGDTLIAGMGLDLREIESAHRRIEALNAELTERLARMTALHEIDRAITASPDLDATLDVILGQAAERLGVDAACVLLHNSRDGTLRMAKGRGLRHGVNASLVLQPGETPSGELVQDLRPRRIDGRAAFNRAFPPSLALGAEEFETYRGIPLIAKGRLQGVLELFHRAPLATDAAWEEFLGMLATQAALALETARLFEQLERSNDELRTAYDTTIEGWARALDLKDHETEGHSRRVTELTVRLARELGIDGDDLVHARRGALLHDIGKMGVPDAVLLKPSKLDPQEWETMKAHATYARDLLAPIPFLRASLDIPYSHHEKWDGSGYPRGLKGGQIPLAARIFAIVDVYDALTNDRPYRKAWSRERTIEYIQAQAGTHFDPVVVKAFLAMLRAGHEALEPSERRNAGEGREGSPKPTRARPTLRNGATKTAQ